MVVGLKVYKVKDSETYEALRNTLKGLAFFRKDNTGFYIKTPMNNVVELFLKNELIEEFK
jgi:hypothetical protein